MSKKTYTETTIWTFFKKRTFVWNDGKWAWVESDNFIVPHEYICSEIIKWQWKAAKLFPPPDNVFRPWPLWKWFGNQIENTYTYHDIHFYKYWLNVYISWASDMLWCHVYDKAKQGDKLCGLRPPIKERDAEKMANEFIKNFKIEFN